MKRYLQFIKQDENDGSGGDGSGGAETSWRDSLDDSLKAEKSLGDYKDINGLAKSHVELQRMMGNSLRVPSSDAGSEDMQKFYDKVLEKAPNLMPKPDSERPEDFDAIFKVLGTPNDASDYNIADDFGGFKPSDDRIASLKATALEAGLTKTQFNKLATSVFNAEGQQIESGNQKTKESLAGLGKEWGMAYDARTAQAIDALEKTGAPTALIEQAKAGNVGADTFKWAYSIANSLGTEGMQVSNQGNGVGSSTPNEAKAQIQEIYSNKAHPFWDRSNPLNKQAMDKMVELQRQANAQ